MAGSGSGVKSRAARRRAGRSATPQPPRQDSDSVILYGAAWCAHSQAARRLLDSHAVHYDFRDIQRNAAAGLRLESLTGGQRSVPTLVVPGRGVMVEPSLRAIRAALDLPTPPRRWWWPF